MTKTFDRPVASMVVTEAGRFLISTDREKLDLEVIHGFLTQSSWAEGISRDTVARSIKHSICFGVYDGPRQIGFARVISDLATYAYLADVFILEPYRGHGLAKELMATIIAHPDLQGLRRWDLKTRNAERLYSQFGFKLVENRDRVVMEIAEPECN